MSGRSWCWLAVTVSSLAVLSVAIGFGAAHGTAQLCERDVQSLLDSYNANVDEVPPIVRGVVADETVHLVVDGDATGEYAAVTNESGRVTEFRPGAPENPTVVIRTDCETVDTIVDADDSVGAFESEYRGGEISVRGVGIVKSVVVEAVEVVVGLARYIGLI